VDAGSISSAFRLRAVDEAAANQWSCPTNAVVLRMVELRAMVAGGVIGAANEGAWRCER
jgi:hypothetical protein